MSMEEIIGRNWLEMFLSIDDSIAFKKLLLECALTGNFPTKRENLILTAGGEQRQIAWTNTVLHDSYGNITGIASIGQDITERSFSEKSSWLFSKFPNQPTRRRTWIRSTSPSTKSCRN